MFTVVISEQSHIDSIREYGVFLQPFLGGDSLAFCAWDPMGKTLRDMVPSLVPTVARPNQWRAVVVCGEEGLHQRNPFDLAPYTPPVQGRDESDADYYPRAEQAKKAAMAQGAEQNLTRLMTFLCETPLTGHDRTTADADPAFAMYKREAEYRLQLRQAILGEEKVDIVLPCEILCLAKRTCSSEEASITSAWTPHVDHQYSRFYEQNLYFDKMRYLVFDILPKYHQDYTFDYIRFLCALLLLAANKVPQGCLQPRRVYTLDCENDEAALCRLLRIYDGKLCATEAVVNRKIKDLKEKELPHLTDLEVKTLFCGRVSVPVAAVSATDTDPLFIPPKEYGLSADCPAWEVGVYDRRHQESLSALHSLLKQPVRSLKRAVEDLHNMNRPLTDRADCLNRLQAGDVAEHVAKEERALFRAALPDFGDEAACRVPLDEADGEVRKCLETRMKKKSTLLLGGIALFMFLLGFLPLLISHTNSLTGILWGAVLAAGALGLLAVVAVVKLWLLRRELTDKVRGYNHVMDGIVREVEDSAALYGSYLSHVCNVMRGHKILSAYRNAGAADNDQLRIFGKHRCDLTRCREELREVFGPYLTLGPEPDQEPYPYDFTRAVDFPYPIPHSRDQEQSIEFLQAGNEIPVKVDFVKRITAKLEELYD